MDVSTARVPLHVRPEDDVIVILVLKSVARVIFSRYVALLRGHVLIPVPIVAGAVCILVRRALKISHESVVCVAVTTRSVDKMSPFFFFPKRTAERDLLSNHVL
jgi:hypothetical protein